MWNARNYCGDLLEWTQHFKLSLVFYSLPSISRTFQISKNLFRVSRGKLDGFVTRAGHILRASILIPKYLGHLRIRMARFSRRKQFLERVKNGLRIRFVSMCKMDQHNPVKRISCKIGVFERIRWGKLGIWTVRKLLNHHSFPGPPI